MTGTCRRQINRKGNIFQVASAALKNAKCVEDCEDWRQHGNARVRLLALITSLKLPYRSNSTIETKIQVETTTSEFDLLVKRFQKEGKKDPIRSARASLATTTRKRGQVSVQA